MTADHEVSERTYEVWRSRRKSDREVRIAYDLDEETAFDLWLRGAEDMPDVNWWIVEVKATRVTTFTHHRRT